MKLYIANYEIVFAPAGLVILAVFIAILVLSFVAIVRIVRRKSQP
jgi:hypothetical protein